MDISGDDRSECNIFINDDAKRRFTNSIFSTCLFSERGFSLDLEDPNLGLPASIGSLIDNKKWSKLCQHSELYNTQIVKEFYSNMRLANKKYVVMVRGFNVSYSEGTINMMYVLKKVDDEYQKKIPRADEAEYEVYMQSLCNPNTTWVESGGKKLVRRMDIKPESKALYQFIKNFVKPTTYNETVNKQ
ncbi:hypothetical protein RYX36_025406, partial [Vicia faba]